MDIYFDKNEPNIHDLIQKINCLNDNEVKILAAISTAIGFLISSFQLLVSYLKEINTDNDATFFKERAQLIEERKKNYDNFKKKRIDIHCYRNKLKIYDQMKDILDFKNSKNRCFSELSRNVDFTNKEKIFEKTFIMNKISYVLDIEENISIGILENSENLNDNLNFIREPINYINYTYDFHYLNEIDISKSKSNIRERLIKQLEATNNEVKLFKKRIKIFENFILKVLEFYLPQLINAANSEFSIFK